MALRGIKVIEFAGLAPAPYCGAILADHGAQVIRIDKHIGGMDADCLSHGKKSLAINLKTQEAVNIVKKLCITSDVLIEPFRKGVMEKLSLGPDVLMRDNPKLIYARLTGYGQSGCLANRAGHDINYIAMSGLLSLLGRAKSPPTPPINLLADFAGGGLICAFGIVLALLQRANSQKGQIIDSSMVEGAAYVGSWIFRGQQLPIWGKPRGYNLLDTGAPYYDTYETKDGKFMAVGALEPQFYIQLLRGLGLNEDEAPQFSATAEENTMLRNKFKTCFASKTQKDWINIFENTDACVTPVLTVEEAMNHPHNKSRNTFQMGIDGCIIPDTAPKLSSTPGFNAAQSQPRPHVGEHTIEILTDLGYSKNEISRLKSRNIIMTHDKHSKL